MRHFSRACPEIKTVLLVESGSRPVLEAAIPRLRGVFGPGVSFGLITCFPGAPAALVPGAAVWRTQAHGAPDARAGLLRELRARESPALAIVCSGEPLMTRWKWWLAWKLPFKVLIINENADCFWLDTGSIATLRQMTSVRMGLSGDAAGRALLQIGMLPFVVGYLLL